MPLTSMATPVAQVPVPPAAPAAPQVHAVPEKTVSNSSLTGFFASFDPIMRPIANVCSTMREIRRSLALPRHCRENAERGQDGADGQLPV